MTRPAETHEHVWEDGYGTRPCECGKPPEVIIADLERKLADTKASFIAYRDELAATDELLAIREAELARRDAVVEAARDVIATKGTSIPIWLPVAALEIAVAALDARKEA